MGLSQGLDAEFADVLNGWHDLEQSLGGGVIVDFNLSIWQSRRPFKDREEVLKTLTSILETPDAQSDRLFFQRVFGLRAYLQDVMNERTTPINEYLPATMGFKLVPFSQTEIIDELRAQATESLAKVGVDFNDALKGLAAVSGQILVDDIPSWFKRHFHEAIKKTNRLFPMAPDVPEPDVSFMEGKGLVRASISGIGKQFSIKFNKEVVQEASEESLEGTLKHEILGHAVQAALWTDQIAAGEWPIHRGLTCMAGFEMFQMEALAEYSQIHYSEKDDLRIAVQDYNFYTRCVTNNFNFMLLSGEESRDAAKRYYMDHTPWRDEEFTERRVNHLTGTSMSRCYSPVYGPGHRLMIHAMETMPESSRDSFMRAMYEGYMDAADVYDLALRMGAKPLTQFEPARPQEVQAIADKLELKA
ncbi:MAG: hypothetical protein DI551_03640 [Micavibrio aeruginosavorus]|uniref:DUF1704 domain-containing protein n=1 Tax=Micavibrio aeruginosavorus TaxID=349221 RepID=A0A2W5N1A6_9BACT|nr:MAG: hypothetical protein DI551_03640 [Micavibrio aeruginosavorus]